MNLAAFEIKFKNRLSKNYEPNSLKTIFYWLMEDRLGYSKADCVLKKQEELQTNQIDQLLADLQQLEAHCPIQHLLEKVSFLDLELFVSPAVLIPRPETEALAAWIRDAVKDRPHTVLDIGTGSGCLALSMAKHWPKVIPDAMDCSLTALEVARENAAHNQLEAHFIHADVLLDELPKQAYDLVVSNPPYIPADEAKTLDKHVLLHEPHEALFVPQTQPLLFYEIIAHWAFRWLNPAGLLFFEIHKDFGGAVTTLLNNLGFSDIELRKDHQGHDRLICAKK